MRHDHTEWLIHFVRDRVPEQDFPVAEDEANLYAGGELEFDASAFCVLKTIIRLGGLIPGHSFRSGRTTIYGGKPAVCATEMPIYSFSEYVRQRGETGAVAAYGIAFLKSEFYSAGGRPVIYGLSNEKVQYKINTSTSRIFDNLVLPLQEQYRYVAYNPAGKNWLDWSHEREWRWIAQNDENDYILCKDSNGALGPTPGLPLFAGPEHGRAFTKLCIIVCDEKEAREIQELLTGFYFAGSNNYDTPFSRSLIENSVIIMLDKLIAAVENGRDLNAQTIEGLQSENLCYPVVIADIGNDTESKIRTALDKATEVGAIAAKGFIKKYNIDYGACGFVNVVSYEITSPIIQCMLRYGLAAGPYDGKTIVNIKEEWQRSQSIDYKEHIYTAVCKSLSDDFGIKFYVDSILD